VTVSLNAQNSSGSVTLDRLCTTAQYALPGFFCGPCPKVGGSCGVVRQRTPYQVPLPPSPPVPTPQNAECVDMFPVPLPRPGYYPATLTEFVACVPSAACPGVDTTSVQSAYARLLGTRGPDLDNLLLRFYASRPPPGAVLVRGPGLANRVEALLGTTLRGIMVSIAPAARGLLRLRPTLLGLPLLYATRSAGTWKRKQRNQRHSHDRCGPAIRGRGPPECHCP
jgi:hypothetical protein